MSWSLAGNLASRKQSVLDQYPGTVIYDIGDESHQASQSDHNRDARDIVHALDVMTYDDHAKGAAVRDWALSQPDDLEYIIFDRHIYERANGFRQRAYTGSDPHEDHVHLSGKHGSVGYSERTGTGYDTAAESMTPDGMAEMLTDEQAKQLNDIAWAVARGAQNPAHDHESGQAFIYWTQTVNLTLQSLVDTMSALAAAQGVEMRFIDGALQPTPTD